MSTHDLIDSKIRDVSLEEYPLKSFRYEFGAKEYNRRFEKATFLLLKRHYYKVRISCHLCDEAGVGREWIAFIGRK